MPFQNKGIKPWPVKNHTDVEHRTQQIYNGIPGDNVSRQGRPADFKRINLHTA